jgi:hypothetical protein
MDIEKINAYIQNRLLSDERTFVTAVEAARWLEDAGLLKDSQTRKGKPLRDLLRAGLIGNAWQDAGKRWFIDQAG